jgi:hypothetical protein
VALTWSSVPGKTYELEFKNLLPAASWSTATNLTATAAFTTVTNVIPGAGQRYYRVRGLD